MLKYIVCSVIVVASCFADAAYKDDSVEGKKDILPKKRVETCFSGIEPPRIDMKNYSPRELYEKNWYQRKPRISKAFNPLFVPFTYRCEEGNADANQTFTFPSLLSLKFDFLDNNICSRHPSFVFQRSEEVAGITIEDTSLSIRKMREWGMNYCIGGSLVQHGELFSGTMVVRDVTGEIILKSSFEPTEYFSLMAKMVVAWINFCDTPDYRVSLKKSLRSQLGFRTDSSEQKWLFRAIDDHKAVNTLSDKLRIELFRPMTETFEAVALFGKTFDVGHRSSEQWALYEKMLELAPDFAEARWLYVNQRGHTKGDSKTKDWKYEMNLQALESHLVIGALRESERNPKAERAERTESVLEQTRKAIPNHWTLIDRADLSNIKECDESGLIALADKALLTPYSHIFATTVADELYHRKMYEYAVPLMISIINSGYNPGNGFIGSYRNLVYILNHLGYYRDAVYLIKPSMKHDSKRLTARLYAGYVARDMLAFSHAEKLFKYCLDKKKHTKLASEFYIGTLLDQGKLSEVKEFTKSDEWKEIDEKLQRVFMFRATALGGRVNETDDIETKLRKLSRKVSSASYKKVFDRLNRYEVMSKLRSDDKSVARTNISYLFSSSPVSLMFYTLFKKVYLEDDSDIYHFAYVMSELSPHSNYWKSEKTTFGEEVEETEKGLNDHFWEAKYSLDTDGYGSVIPMKLEYYSLRLLHTNREKYRQQILDVWKELSERDKKITSSLKMHRRRFYYELAARSNKK